MLKALLGVVRFYWDSTQHAHLVSAWVTASLHGWVGPVRSWEKLVHGSATMGITPASLYSVPPLAKTASDSVDSTQVSPEILTQGKNRQMAANFLESNFEKSFNSQGDVNSNLILWDWFLE